MVDPKVVDGELAEVHGEIARQEQHVLSALRNLHFMVGDREHYVGRRSVWGLTDAEAEQNARAGNGVQPWDRRAVEDTLGLLDGHRAALGALRERARELAEAYTGWSRFFLVPDGHIHRSMACSTCRVTTQFGWLPDLSGDTEEAAVAAHGALLCTVCYPSAPVEWTNAHELAAAARAAARCDGSGQGPEQRRGWTRGTCRVCGTWQTLTPSGYVRAHRAAG